MHGAEGLSIKEITRRLGVARNTVRSALRSEGPPVFDRKRKAMEVMSAQHHLIDYYTELGKRRGVQARRNGAPGDVVQAEAYQRVFPVVGDELV